jgi:hypothetical protein
MFLYGLLIPAGWFKFSNRAIRYEPNSLSGFPLNLPTTPYWGYNSDGPVGNGLIADSYRCRGKPYLYGIVQLLQNVLNCWEDNSSGELGFANSRTTSYPTPRLVGGF